jgi:hypothetical protein
LNSFAKMVCVALVKLWVAHMDGYAGVITGMM